MNLSISHDSEVKAFVFPFLFLEVSSALGAINGYGKTKSNAFTTPNLKCLLVLEQKKKERRRRRRRKMKERERGVYSAKGKKKGLCCVKMKKERGVYIGVGEGVGFGY